MKQKTKRFRGGGLSDLGSLALVGGLGYMFGRGNKSKAEKEKAVIADAAKAAEPEKKEPEPKRGFGASDIGFTGDGKDADTTQVKPEPMAKKVTTAPKKTKKPSGGVEIGKRYVDAVKPPADNDALKSKPYPSDVKPSDERPTKRSTYPSAETKPEAKPEQARNVNKEKAKSGFGPKLTFNTPERLESARKAYYKGFKAGGTVKSSASKRADGIAQRGKTRGRVM